MPLIQLVIILVVVGVILWVINSYIPMQSTIMRNPFYLDSKSGTDWTLNPFSTGQ